jgi:cytochrome c553
MKPKTRLAGVFWIFLLTCAAAPAGAQNIAAGQSKYPICASCHGIEGRSFKPHYPILAGQSEQYLFLQLYDFKDGRRSDSSMELMASQLSTQDMRDLAAYFGSLESHPSSRFIPNLEKAARGKAQAAKLECARCHPENSNFATKDSSHIAAQLHDYVAKQLRDFRDGRRVNDAGAMRRVTQALTDADIDDLGNYYAGIRQ